MTQRAGKLAAAKLEGELAKHYGEICWEAWKTDVGTFEINIGRPTMWVSTILKKNNAGVSGALNIVYWDDPSRVQFIGDSRINAQRKMRGGILKLAQVGSNSLKLTFDNRGSIIEAIFDLVSTVTHGNIQIRFKGKLFTCVDGTWSVDRIDR